MAKSALLALAQSLATELGPAGNPGQFRCPRLHLGRHLKRYFDYLADEVRR